MKKLLLFALCLCAPVLHAAVGFRIYTTFIITNSANLTNGIQFTLNGDVRTGEDIVTNAATQFARSNRIDHCMTNLYGHIAAYGFANVQLLPSTATNNIQLVGGTNQVMVASVFGAWGFATNVTNTVYTGMPVVTPMVAESNAFKNAIMSALLTDLQTWATNKFSNNAPAFAEFLTTTTNLANYTNKNFANGTNWNTVLAGASGQLRNVGLSNVVATNFTSPGAGSGSLRIGDLAEATGIGSIAFGVQALGHADGTVTLGTGAQSEQVDQVNIGNNSISLTGIGSTAVGSYSSAAGLFSGAYGNSAAGSFDYSFGIGYAASATAAHQIRLGRATEFVSIPGNLDVNGTQTVFSAIATNLSSPNATISGGTVSNSITKADTLYASAGLLNNVTLSNVTLIDVTQQKSAAQNITSGTVSNVTLYANSATVATADITNLTARGGSVSNANGSFNNLAAGMFIFTNLLGSNTIASSLYLNAGSYAALANGASTTNVIQASTNPVTLLSGNTAECYVQSMKDWFDRTPDTPRWVIVKNNTAYNQNFNDESVNETVPGRRFKLGGYTFTLTPYRMALFWYDTTDARWLLMAHSSQLTASATNVTIQTVGTTNATHVDLLNTNTTAGVPQTKTISPGRGMSITNESGTNVSLAFNGSDLPALTPTSTMANSLGNSSMFWHTGYIGNIILGNGVMEWGTSLGIFTESNNLLATNYNLRPKSTAAGTGLTIGPAGNAGFGIATPTNTLNVVGSFALQGSQTNSGDVVANGNVSAAQSIGAGTTTPSAKIQANGTRWWFQGSNTVNAMRWGMPGGWTNANSLGFTNHSAGGTLTNLSAVNLPALALTNAGAVNADRATITFYVQPKRNPGTNTLTVVYGSETVASITTRVTNNVYKIDVEITQVSVANQDVLVTFNGADSGAGTNSGMATIYYRAAQSNWVDTLVQLQGAASSPYAFTNFGFKTFYEPAQ